MGQMIEIHGIKKRFQEQVVFENLNLSIEKGKTTCIMGNSGCGKTTLLHILLGLIQLDAGSIEGMEGYRKAAVFQEDRLCEEFDALTNVRLVTGSSVTEEMINQEFKKVGLTDYKHKPIGKLSGGMRRRIAIVRAILSDYEILVLDEPLKGLDAALKQQVMQYVKEATRGKTVIMVTHEKEEAQAMADRIILLS